MSAPPMKFLHDPAMRVSVMELAEIIGTDPITIDNWLRRKIISRAPGVRKFKYRLFAAEEVYKTALKSELVNLGIQPSLANDAINAFWKEWDAKQFSEAQNLYAIIVLSKGQWTITLCVRKNSGGPLYKLRKGKSSEEMDLPKKAFAVIPISDVFERVSSKISGLFGG
jgi:IS30 family transposase